MQVDVDVELNPSNFSLCTPMENTFCQLRSSSTKAKEIQLKLKRQRDQLKLKVLILNILIQKPKHKHITVHHIHYIQHITAHHAAKKPHLTFSLPLFFLPLHLIVTSA